METIAVAAAVICDSQGRVLATQRGYGEWKGWWEFPGGKLEDGETPEQALQREIREELCVEIRVDKPLCTINYDYPTFHLAMCCYICTQISGNLTLAEHQAARWLAPSQLDTLKWLPADVEVVEKLKGMTKKS